MSGSPLEINIEFPSKSLDLFYMPTSGSVTKVVQPGEVEFLMHTVADPGADTFIKRCTVRHSTL